MIIAIDLGLKRIGVASSATGTIATPHRAIIRKNRNQASSELRDILKEYKADKLVVGIPLGGSSEDEMRRRIEHFIKLVDFDGEVVLQDEAGTSIEAEDMIKGEFRNKRDGKVDSIAAMLILKRYLKIL